MSGRRRRSESLWDRKEDAAPQTEMSEKIPRQGKELHSSLHGDTSPKRSNSEANDALISADFSGPPMQGNANMPTDNDNSRDRHRMNTDPAFDEWENQYSSRPSDDSYGLPYRAGGTGNMSRDRERSRSPNESRSRGRDRDRSRSRSRSRGRARSPFSGDRNSGDRPRNRGSDGYRKDHHRGNRNANDDQDHRRQSTQTSRVPCKFFSMGKCNRNNCKFSHDNIEIQGHNSGNNNTGSSWNDVDSATFDDKNTWNKPEKNAYVLSQHTDKPSNEGSQAQLANATIAVMPEVPANSYFQQHPDDHNMNQQIPSYGQDFIQQSSLNGSGQDMFLHMDLQNQTEIQAGKPLETWKNDIPQESSLPVSLPQIANALELLYALPISAASGGEFIKPSIPSSEQISTGDPNSKLRAVGVPDANEEPAGNLEGNENPGKSEAQQGKVEESNISNDEKAMRQFKIALVEFVKEILKPTWKEGKMSREVYKTIVKKVVDKVTSTIQGNQIPRTQEKIDQYLAFSKSKITKLVEAYVGRFLKA